MFIGDTADFAPTCIDVVMPDAFVSEMERHWRLKLDNVPSDALKQLWRIMGETYAEAIQDTLSVRGSRDYWRILRPPTGTGKTQGLCVYSAMTVKENLGRIGAFLDRHFDPDFLRYFHGESVDPLTGELGPPPSLPLGILVVTRMKAQCDEVVETIRSLLRYDPELKDFTDEEIDKLAVAYHQDSQLDEDTVQNAHVLVITHAAYVLAVSRIGAPSNFEQFTRWLGDRLPRALTVVDESIGSVVDTSQVTYEKLSLILTALGPGHPVRQSHPQTMRLLDELQRAMLQFSQDAEVHGRAKYADVSELIRSARGEMPENKISFKPIRKALRSTRLDVAVSMKLDHTDHLRLTSMLTEVLRDLEVIVSRWAYFAKEGAKTSYNTSSFVIPAHIAKPVCLDATATHNVVWTLLESRAQVLDNPKGTRRYSNVTFHIASIAGQGLGKGKMRERVDVRVPRLLDDLRDRLSAKNDVLVVCHKRVAPAFVSYLIEDTDVAKGKNGLREWYYLPNADGGRSAKVRIGWWGALDGLNDFQTCDTAVIFGLPYMDSTWAYNMFFAIQSYDKKHLTGLSYKGQMDFELQLEYSQMAQSVIQAVNRVRCRRVIDEDGNCPNTNIYVALPAFAKDGSLQPEAAHIRRSLAQDMAGAKFIPWDFELEGPASRLRANGAPEALLLFLQHAEPGKYTKRQLVKDVAGVSEKAMKKISERLSKREPMLTQALAEVCCEYIKTSGGPTNPAYIQKYEENEWEGRQLSRRNGDAAQSQSDISKSD